MKKLILLYLLIFFFSVSYAQQYTINGSATQDNCHCYTLTQAVGNQSGSVWNNNKINLTQSFDFTFDVFLGFNDGGADGIAFVLQPISTSVGGNGGGMGFMNIDSSIGVTLDTYQNGLPAPTCTDHGDPAADHIAIQLDGSILHCAPLNNVAGPVNISATSANVEDGLWHTLRIVWNAATTTLTVYFDGNLRVTRTQDFVNTSFVLNGNPWVYWGFTAGTGGLNNIQRFCTKLTPGFYFPPSQKKCEGQSIQFLDSTVSFAPLAKFYWNFGDGSPIDSVNLNPVHIYTVGGNYTVTYTVVGADGCVEVKTQLVMVSSKPVAHIDLTNACVNATVNFTDISTSTFGAINNWYWDLGDGTNSIVQNPTNTYATAGNKTVRLAVKNVEGCLSDTVSRTLTIHPLPVSNFSFINNQCQNTSVQFNDMSGVPTGTISTWNWSFGNSNTSTLQHPTTIFTNPGTFTVTLTVTTNNNCTHISTQQITIRPKPVAYFKNNTICQSALATLTDSSYTTDGSLITGWWWDLGNGQFSTNQNPTVTYTTGGTVTIRLVVTSVGGCLSDTLTRQLTVNAKPVANFTHTDSCVLSTIRFFDASTGGVGSYFWNFDNTLTATTANPTTTYSTYGIKNVKLAVTSTAGCLSDTVTKLVRIRARPVADFSFTDSVCLGTATFFFDNSTLADGPVNGWIWNFGDSAFNSNSQNPVHFFLAPGPQTVWLMTTGTGNADCLSSMIQKTVFVMGKPTAYFKTGILCQSAATTLQDSSYTTGGGNITGWWWDLGNGQFSTQQNPLVTYNTAGPITVRLVVVNSRGCRSDTLTRVVNIVPKPVAKFGHKDPLCSNVAVQFSDSSTVTGGNINQWTWIHNAAVFSSQQNPSTILPAGSQSVGLCVSAAGCKSDTVFKTILVNPKPVITFSFSDTCKNTINNFTANSSVPINQWNWSFGDGSTSSLQNPQHSYSSNGSYPVSLYAVAASGCYSDTLKKDITIFGTNADAGPDLIAAAGQPVQLQGSGGVSYEWTPSTGLSNAFIANPVATIFADQTYTLKALTPGGCESFDQVIIKIYKGPEIYVPSAFSPNGDGRNDILRAFPVGITTFLNFSVFNRYGERIFSTDDYSKGWDGSFKAARQNSGVYIWMASGIDFKGNKISRKGTVMLIR